MKQTDSEGKDPIGEHYADIDPTFQIALRLLSLKL